MNGRMPLPGDGETIAALATPNGRGALAILRLSGPGVRAIGEALITPFQWAPGRTYLATLRASDGAAIDQVMVSVHAAPRSYTGEDVLELTTHGGHLVPALALDALLAAGARMALPGEFTRRAVAHGKMDLLQAEAAADLVDARSAAMHHSALHQLEGGLTRRVEALRSAVLHVSALLAYDVDFPEEDEGGVPRARVLDAAQETLRALDALLGTAHAGEILRDGAVVVLAGPPNSGKSSLFNALLGTARAIVTEIPGTTRDALEALIDVHGWPVRLVDTAGLREGSRDTVERLGIEIAERYVAGADLVLVCGETDEQLCLADARVGAITSARRLGLRTKADLVAQGDETSVEGRQGMDHLVADQHYMDQATTLRVSARSGAGLGALGTALGGALSALQPGANGATGLLTRERHRRAVERARDEMQRFVDAWAARTLPSPVAGVHVREAAAALESLIGTVDAEDVLEIVFRSFCVGK